jgi:hypothetical protein
MQREASPDAQQMLIPHSRAVCYSPLQMPQSVMFTIATEHGWLQAGYPFLIHPSPFCARQPSAHLQVTKGILLYYLLIKTSKGLKSQMQCPGESLSRSKRSWVTCPWAPHPWTHSAAVTLTSFPVQRRSFRTQDTCSTPYSTPTWIYLSCYFHNCDSFNSAPPLDCKPQESRDVSVFLFKTSPFLGMFQNE